MNIPQLNPRSGWLGWWPINGLKGILDPAKTRIHVFLKEEAEKLPDDIYILDVGAGKRTYEELFKRQKYQSCDVKDGFYKHSHDFFCKSDDIPQPNETYHAVILTQVLEHVPNPYKALNEIYRILKPGGIILASAPLNSPLHGEPWHFFHFTHYALLKLAEESNLEIIQIEKIGGSFWNLGRWLPSTLKNLLKQWDPGRARRRGQNLWIAIFMSLLLLPFYLISYPLAKYVFGTLCYWMDRLDQQKSFTIGYTFVMKKP